MTEMNRNRRNSKIRHFMSIYTLFNNLFYTNYNFYTILQFIFKYQGLDVPRKYNYAKRLPCTLVPYILEGQILLLNPLKPGSDSFNI